MLHLSMERRNTMMRSSETLRLILAFREKKVKERKRPISFSEAITLWLNEGEIPSIRTDTPKGTFL